MSESNAVISDCLKYRYMLKRPADFMCPMKSTALFIMLNPSTADATLDDPTIRRVRGFSKLWDCNGVIVANLYAYRATNPKELLTADDPIGPENDEWLSRLAREHGDIVCAWGANAKQDRVDKFIELVSEFDNVRLWCLGLTKKGAPKHPLYIKADQPLIPFNKTESREE